MKILFFREGFAHNSSSTHSLIFLTKKNVRDKGDPNYFGFEFFTAKSKKRKLQYLFYCIKDSFLKRFSISYGFDINYSIYYEFEEFILDKYFKKWFMENIYEKCIFKDYIDIELLDHMIHNNDPHVDHQSLLDFPIYRNKKIFNSEFICDFINEIVKKPYVILGGNDNEIDSHPLINAGDNSYGDDIIQLWNFLKGGYRVVQYCEYDENNQCYVLNQNETSGSIIMVKFGEC